MVRDRMVRKVMMAVGVLAMSGTLAAYQYERAGTLPSAATSVAAATCPVATGRGREARGISTLDARFRTLLESEAVKILTTPVTGVTVIVR